jgi:threonine/homoserine/homoserine lactone efflux protein
MLGVMLGYALMVTIVGLGLSRIFLMIPWLQTCLKVASILYLLYLAFRIATSTPPTFEAGEGRGKPLTFLQAAAFQWVNPKGWTMALTACSAYMPPLGPTLGALVIAAISVVVNVPVVELWTAMGMHLRRLLAEPYKLRLFNWTAAALLVASLYPVIKSH